MSISGFHSDVSQSLAASDEHDSGEGREYKLGVLDPVEDSSSLASCSSNRSSITGATDLTVNEVQLLMREYYIVQEIVLTNQMIWDYLLDDCCF